MSGRQQPMVLLPNTPGFRFVGMRHDGTELPCMVKRGTDGKNFISGIEFNQLRSWRSM